MRCLRRRWRAMGTDCHVVVVVEDDATDPTPAAVALVEHLEARWSRFRPCSDVCRVNAAAGAPVAVGPETLEAVATAVEARDRTGGRFDPTMLAALVAAGYDRSFDELPPVPPTGPPAPGGAAVTVDRAAGTVRVAAGAGLDLGGIGKGLAADLVADQLLAMPGVAGACVNLGGDLRCAGRAPDPDPDAWGVSIETGGMLALAAGGVATSTTSRRRWTGADGETRHHVIDPATGRPADVRAETATVVAATAADAEVLATVALLDPDALPAGTAAVVVRGGRPIDTPALAAFRR